MRSNSPQEGVWVNLFLQNKLLFLKLFVCSSFQVGVYASFFKCLVFLEWTYEHIKQRSRTVIHLQHWWNDLGVLLGKKTKQSNPSTRCCVEGHGVGGGGESCRCCGANQRTTSVSPCFPPCLRQGPFRAAGRCVHQLSWPTSCRWFFLFHLSYLTWLCVDSGDLNSGPQACAASTSSLRHLLTTSIYSFFPSVLLMLGESWDGFYFLISDWASIWYSRGTHNC